MTTFSLHSRRIKIRQQKSWQNPGNTWCCHCGVIAIVVPCRFWNGCAIASLEAKGVFIRDNQRGSVTLCCGSGWSPSKEPRELEPPSLPLGCGPRNKGDAGFQKLVWGSQHTFVQNFPWKHPLDDLLFSEWVRRMFTPE